MRVFLALLSLASVVPAGAAADNGIASVASNHSVAESLDRLEAIGKSKGLTIFARLDFAGDAANNGLQMRPAQLLIFGNPKAGTPLMLAAPSVALDLPLKALAWEDASGKVWLSFNTPEYLRSRHGVPAELLPNIAGIEALVEQAAQ
jgi:uncharacterized protein (DUF302 family)